MSLKPSSLSSVGQRYHDFEVTKVMKIPELHCELRELIHLPTGAQVMQIHNDDPENLFCLSFQTCPDSSNGVAHVLEHTVLCGSAKFPVKDPFFAMSRRSLNTFMNAFTGADFTCYPASSQVHKDFYNILEVYLDAVFHPVLHEFSFLQEGHRLEFTDPENSNSPLEHKGVVFNEMKGALVSAEARLDEAMHQALFPDVTYGFNSGGDPKEIPSLTYQELSEFYLKYYNPSRCLFFFYGNMPLEPHLDFITKYALTDVKKADPLPSIPFQKRFDAPRYLTMEYPVGPDDTASEEMIAFGWLTCHILQQQELLALSILEIVLLGNDAAPLKHALLQSGLCKQVSVMLEDEMNEVPITIILKGCKVGSTHQIEEVMKKTLQELMKTGIPLQLIEHAMHQLEFARSEITGNHAPYGLSLFMRSALLKQHQGHPEDGLKIHSLFDHLRKITLEDSSYWTRLLKTYFIDNTHRVCITMSPNPKLGVQEAKEERLSLEETKKELTPGQVEHIVEQAKNLLVFQEKQENHDVDVLPKLTLEDVPAISRDYPLICEESHGLTLYHHNCFTNEIVNAALIFPLPHIPEEDLLLLRLLTVFISQMGCGGRNYVDNLEYIQANTGGFWANIALNAQADSPGICRPTFEIRSKSLYRKANKMFPLLRDVAFGIDFKDLARFKQVLLKHYTALHSNLPQNALRYASSLAASGLDLPGKLSNLWLGLDYYLAIKKLASGDDAAIKHLAERLEAFQNRILGLEDATVLMTCSATMANELKHHRFYGLPDIPRKSYPRWQGDYSVKPVHSQAKTLALPLAYTSYAFKTIPYVHPDAAALTLAASLFDNLVLHPRIREQGGAYGAGALDNSLTGAFCFYSYRDPNISSTLDAFQEAMDTVVDGKFQERDLEEAKMEAIQGLDAPVAPGSRGDVAFSRLQEGRPMAVRQLFRNRLLSATKQEVISAVSNHVVPQSKSGVTIVFAGTELLQKENETLAAEGKPRLPVYEI